MFWRIAFWRVTFLGVVACWGTAQAQRLDSQLTEAMACEPTRQAQVASKR